MATTKVQADRDTAIRHVSSDTIPQRQTSSEGVRTSRDGGMISLGLAFASLGLLLLKLESVPLRSAAGLPAEYITMHLHDDELDNGPKRSLIKHTTGYDE